MNRTSISLVVLSGLFALAGVEWLVNQSLTRRVFGAPGQRPSAEAMDAAVRDAIDERIRFANAEMQPFEAYDAFDPYESVQILPELSVRWPDGSLRMSARAESSAYSISYDLDLRIEALDRVLAERLIRRLSRDGSVNAASASRRDTIAVQAREEKYSAAGPYVQRTTSRVASEADQFFSVYSLHVSGLDFKESYHSGGATFRTGGDHAESMDTFIADKAALKEIVMNVFLAEMPEWAADKNGGPLTRSGLSERLFLNELWEKSYVLNASNHHGKFAGMTIPVRAFLFKPDTEGSILITIPAERLKPVLVADRAHLFDGEPEPLPEILP
jgi:hypothetical protein